MELTSISNGLEGDEALRDENEEDEEGEGERGGRLVGGRHERWGRSDLKGEIL